MAPLPNPSSDHPKWMNRAFFTDIVRQDSPTCKIVSFSVKPINTKDSAASVIYQVKAKVENDRNGLTDRSYFVKFNNSTDLGAELANTLSVFPKEIEMYTEILPKFEKYFKEIGEPAKLGPRCFFAHTDPVEMIIMEDLGFNGFKSADRHQGLDLEHCEVAIAKIAQFHAASAKYVEEVGNYSPKFDQGIFSTSFSDAKDKQRDQFLGMLRMFMQGLNCTPILNRVFDHFKELLADRVHDCVELKKDRFNVLCHGDLWSNNIMFKYTDEGQLEDCLLVDYQMCFYNSPMLDLQYFIFTSVHKDHKLSKIDYLLQFYHKHLVANLKKLNYQQRLPTLLELHKDFLACGAYGVISTFTVFPVTTALPSEDSVLDEGEKGIAAKAQIYTNPVYRAAMEELIPYFDRKGYFDL